MGEDGSRPALYDGESVLLEQPLVFLWSGGDIRRDAEGRGTLLLTSRRVMFLSDEDDTKNLAWGYEDFSLHATSLSRHAWPHQFLLAKISDAAAGAEEDGATASAAATPVWTRRCRRVRHESDEDQDYLSDGDNSAAGVVVPAQSAAAPSAAAAAAAASAATAEEEEWEDRVVEELRFVPAKPAEQRQHHTRLGTSTCAAEGRGLTVESSGWVGSSVECSVLTLLLCWRGVCIMIPTP